MKKKAKKPIEEFRLSLESVAKDLEKLPQEVTKIEYVHSKTPGKLKEWTIRCLGGFNGCKKLLYPDAIDRDASSFKHGSKLIKSFKNKIEKKFAEDAFMKDEVLAVLEESLKANTLHIHKPIKYKKSKKSKNNKPRTLVAHLSDTHYGANIEKSEVGGVNEYNWTLAARRTALFVEQIVNYKPQYRDHTKLVFCINGDIIAGVIHDQEWFADLLTTQFTGALDILTQAVTFLAQHFPEVEVHCQAGNHGRAMHKSSKDRAATHKWDSYEHMLFLALQKVVESTHHNVKVSVPNTPYSIVEINGHHFFLTHGDTVFTVGNPGTSLNMKAINTQIVKLNASELGGNAKFAAVLVGHVHTSTIQLTESGCMLVINGCLSGTDPFANSIGIFESHPTQQLFEVTEDHAVGDIRMIQVKGADKREELDQIIKPFVRR